MNRLVLASLAVGLLAVPSPAAGPGVVAGAVGNAAAGAARQAKAGTVPAGSLVGTVTKVTPTSLTLKVTEVVARPGRPSRTRPGRPHVSTTHHTVTLPLAGEVKVQSQTGKPGAMSDLTPGRLVEVGLVRVKPAAPAKLADQPAVVNRVLVAAR